MKKTWTALVEIDFPIEGADIKPIFDDDDIIDYMWRAHSRLQKRLGDLRKEGCISHFTIKEVPHLNSMEGE